MIHHITCKLLEKHPFCQSLKLLQSTNMCHINIIQPVLTTFVDIFKYTSMISFSCNAWIICKTSIYSAICPVTSIHFLYYLSLILIFKLCQDGLVVSVSTSHAVGHGLWSSLGHTKDHYKNASLRGT